MALVSFDHIGGDYIVFALELLVVVVVDDEPGCGCLSADGYQFPGFLALPPWEYLLFSEATANELRTRSY